MSADDDELAVAVLRGSLTGTPPSLEELERFRVSSAWLDELALQRACAYCTLLAQDGLLDRYAEQARALKCAGLSVSGPTTQDYCVDHFVPVTRRGSDYPDNHWPSCRLHNQMKSDMDPREFPAVLTEFYQLLLAYGGAFDEYRSTRPLIRRALENLEATLERVSRTLPVLSRYYDEHRPRLYEPGHRSPRLSASRRRSAKGVYIDVDL